MQLEFTKMHGLGNDFLVLEAPPGNVLPSAAQWRALADRHAGIGFDQALLLEPARAAGTAVHYRVFNADGSEVEQCGNGARCVARFLQLHGRVAGVHLTAGHQGQDLSPRFVHDESETHSCHIVKLAFRIRDPDGRRRWLEALDQRPRAQAAAAAHGDQADRAFGALELVEGLGHEDRPGGTRPAGGGDEAVRGRGP